jgi:hypothetical protein
MIGYLCDFRAALAGVGEWDEALQRGEVRLAFLPTVALAAALYAGYGLCLGSYTWAMGASPYRWQPPVSVVKMPVLFGWTDIGFTLFRPAGMTFLEGIRFELHNLGHS